MLGNTTDSYGLVSRALHWLLAALLIVVLVLGLVVEDMAKGPLRVATMNWHKSLGLVILTLMVMRLAWRLVQPVPRPMGGVGARRLASAMHWGLYALAIAQPLSGWLLTQAAGRQLALFGQIPLPMLIAESEVVEDLMEGVHGTLWIVLIVAVLGHAAAAFKHHVIDRDRTLVRMLKG